MSTIETQMPKGQMPKGSHVEALVISFVDYHAEKERVHTILAEGVILAYGGMFSNKFADCLNGYYDVMEMPLPKQPLNIRIGFN